MKKYKFTDNLGLKIIAVIFAAFLWLIVVNLDNPVSTQTFSEVPVTIINEDIILSAGDTYQVLGEEKVSVVVSATRQVRQKLTKEDIVATADIKEMDTSTGLVPIKISIPNYAGKYESAEAAPRNLQIQREKSGKKVLSLTVSTRDSKVRDGYILGDMTVNPDKVTITGPESILDQIDRARWERQCRTSSWTARRQQNLGCMISAATRSVRHGWEIILARAALLCLLKC